MAFIDTWKEVIQTPSKFYENMPTTGGLTEPLKFVVICYIPLVIITLLSGLYSSDVFGILLSPMILLVGIVAILIESFLVHVGVFIFAKDNMKGFEATVRVVSYSSAVALISNSISWIPIIGTLLSIPLGIYGLYIGVVGIMKVHQTTGIKALLSYLILLIVVGIIFVVIFFLLILTMGPIL